MLSHLSVLVTQQSLRVPEVAGIARGLRADVPELEAHAGCLARFVEARPQGQRAARPAVLVLDQVGAVPRALARVDPLDDLTQLAADLHGSLRAGLVLRDQQGADVFQLDLQNVGGPLTGEEGNS